MDFQTWLTFVAATIALLLIPGPTIMLVLTYAITQGKRVALATVCGVGLGDFIAMSASLLGLGALVLASTTLFIILKWLGAVYLVYLGIKLFVSTPNICFNNLERVGEISTSSVFYHATVITALNPKSIIFFIAFVPQFIVVDSPVLPQFAFLIITFVVLGTMNALMYALLANKLRSKITQASVLVWFSRFGGSVLIVMGIVTVMFKRTQ